LLELAHIAGHVKWRRVHKQKWFVCFSVCVLVLATEFFEVGIKGKLYVECPSEALIEDFSSEALSLYAFGSRKEGLKLLRLNVARVK
jgi:hypothetical protein